MNSEPVPIGRIWDVKTQAQKECSIEYDTVSVAYDEAAEVWYFTANTLGNCQSVCIDCDDVTLLSVYGE